MSHLRPVAIYGLQVPAGGFDVEANPEKLPASFRITMAAIDPTAKPKNGKNTPAGPPRATLKLIRLPFDADSEDDGDEDDDLDEDGVIAIERRLGITSDDDDESAGGEANGGPGEKTKHARTAALIEALKKKADEEEEDDMSVELTNGVNGVKVNKGKGKASDESGSDDESEDSGDELGVEEFVLCTLDATQHYQQTLDIIINDGEQVYFRADGAFNIHLTGNYIIPEEELDNSDDEDYDEEDEMNDALAGLGEIQGMSDQEDSSEEDELDGLADPRIMEVDSEEEAPKLVVTAEKPKKGKNKRVADESLVDDVAENILEKVLKPEDVTNGEKKLSKKQLKKLKNNAGEATEAPKAEEKPAGKKDAKSEAKKETPSKEVNGSGKKVQFAKDLEQGPTPTKADTQKGKGTKVISGVTIDDRKIGKGPGAKKGDKVGMRYIGKLKDGKVFDSNTKGEAFKFKLGVGEVIKGWDIGVQGIAPGGERRLIIPANLAYGKQAQKGIPSNSELHFDIKCLTVN